MGHATYHDALEKTFRESIPEVEFTGVKLTECPKSLPSRIAYKLLTLPVPMLGPRDYLRLRLELGSSLYARQTLRKMIKTTRPDVLHIHTQAIALLARDLMAKVPTVINIDYTTALLARDHPHPAEITYRPIIVLEQKCFQAAAHVLCWNDKARKSVMEDYGIAPEKVTTVHPAVPLEMFLHMERGGESTRPKPRLLFVGNDFERKGGWDLVKVFQEGLSQSCELDIVSNAAVTLPAIPGLRQHRGLKPLSAELLELYRQADIFVLPSHEDVFPMAFVEAMAAGLACVGTRVMAIPEMVEDGYNGILIQPRDVTALKLSLTTLIQDAPLRRKMGENGRKKARAEFDNIINYRRIAEIFRQVANTGAAQ